MGPRVKAFFDEETFTVSYAVSEPEGGRAAIIDRAVAEKSRAGRNRLRIVHWSVFRAREGC